MLSATMILLCSTRHPPRVLFSPPWGLGTFSTFRPPHLAGVLVSFLCTCVFWSHRKSEFDTSLVFTCPFFYFRRAVDTRELYTAAASLSLIPRTCRGAIPVFAFPFLSYDFGGDAFPARRAGEDQGVQQGARGRKDAVQGLQQPSRGAAGGFWFWSPVPLPSPPPFPLAILRDKSF